MLRSREGDGDRERGVIGRRGHALPIAPVDRLHQPLGDRDALPPFLPVIAGGAKLQRGHETRKLLAPDLEHAPDPLVRRLLRALFGGSEGRLEDLGMDEGILLLQGRGPDEVPPSGKEARRRRPPDELAPGAGDEIGAELHPAPEVLGRQLRRGGVDDHRNAVAVGDLRERLEVDRQGLRHIDVKARGGPLREGRMHLPLVGTDAARRAEIPELDESRAGDAQGMIERVPVRAVDDDLVAEPGGVGKAVHRREVVAGHAGGRRQRQAGIGAGGDTPGFGAGQRHDELRRARLHLGNGDEGPRRGRHCRDDRRRQARAAEPARIAGRVDHGPEAHRCQKIVILAGMLVHDTVSCRMRSGSGRAA